MVFAWYVHIYIGLQTQSLTILVYLPDDALSLVHGVACLGSVEVVLNITKLYAFVYFFKAFQPTIIKYGCTFHVMGSFLFTM